MAEDRLSNEPQIPKLIPKAKLITLLRSLHTQYRQDIIKNNELIMQSGFITPDNYSADQIKAFNTFLGPMIEEERHARINAPPIMYAAQLDPFIDRMLNELKSVTDEQISGYLQKPENAEIITSLYLSTRPGPFDKGERSYGGEEHELSQLIVAIGIKNSPEVDYIKSFRDKDMIIEALKTESLDIMTRHYNGNPLEADAWDALQLPEIMDGKIARAIADLKEISPFELQQFFEKEENAQLFNSILARSPNFQSGLTHYIKEAAEKYHLALYGLLPEVRTIDENGFSGSRFKGFPTNFAEHSLEQEYVKAMESTGALLDEVGIGLSSENKPPVEDNPEATDNTHQESIDDQGTSNSPKKGWRGKTIKDDSENSKKNIKKRRR